LIDIPKNPVSGHPRHHYDQCAGCGRYCFAKRAINVIEGVTVTAFCASPWAAQVITRKRTIEFADGVKIGERAIVCSLRCYAKMSKDAWEFAEQIMRESRKSVSLWLNDDALVLRYGSNGAPPLAPSTGWVLLPGRGPLHESDGPYR